MKSEDDFSVKKENSIKDRFESSAINNKNFKTANGVLNRGKIPINQNSTANGTRLTEVKKFEIRKEFGEKEKFIETIMTWKLYVRQGSNSFWIKARNNLIR
ncbi:hypothetical protein KQX54_006628 [Cotesia glomerata]|uniref:Uncharacterized protein n=1 Tax=Cotesia glomerata TaxID=32391 RepID=A0AAV7ITJ7_COTGL|nr:hypothetical protein KQX54_006628 [Cotesia glomerata]